MGYLDALGLGDNSWFEKYGRPQGRAGQYMVAPVAPEPAKATPTSIIGLTPGYTPNYRDLILGDASYQAYANNSMLDVNQAAARRKAALQALVVRYGGVGEGFQDPYGDIDETTRELASKNEFSDKARIDRNYKQGVEAFKKALAGRRGLSSGELGYGMDQADYARAASEYDLGQEFSNTAATAVNDFVGAENAVRAQQSAALAQAESNVYANPANRPTEGTQASLVSGWESSYGVPVYQGPDGSLWTLGPDGNPVPYTPQAAPAAAPAPSGATDPYDPYYWNLGTGLPRSY